MRGLRGPGLHAVPQRLRFRQPFELLQRVVLDLADPLARDAEGAADLLERPRRPTVEPEAELDHLTLALRQRAQLLLDRGTQLDWFDSNEIVIEAGLPSPAGCGMPASARVTGSPCGRPTRRPGVKLRAARWVRDGQRGAGVGPGPRRQQRRTGGGVAEVDGERRGEGNRVDAVAADVGAVAAAEVVEREDVRMVEGAHRPRLPRHDLLGQPGVQVSQRSGLGQVLVDGHGQAELVEGVVAVLDDGEAAARIHARRPVA